MTVIFLIQGGRIPYAKDCEDYSDSSDDEEHLRTPPSKMLGAYIINFMKKIYQVTFCTFFCFINMPQDPHQ